MYFISCDVARGAGKDYSAFTITDITEMPYRLVGRYRNNEISPMLYPTVIEKAAKDYNDAFVLIEINDIGAQVADILYYDLEYENVLSSVIRGRSGQVLSPGFSKGTSFGVKTTPNVKRIGCRVLKDLIEEDQLMIKDYNTVRELTTFAVKGKSYQAEEGHTDDLVMTLVLFAWVANQRYFIELNDQDMRTRMYEEQMKAIEENMLPFGVLSDGIGEDGFVDDTGQRWEYAEGSRIGYANDL
jgi:hypothetical protein